jgi:hypothetical protein
MFQFHKGSINILTIFQVYSHIFRTAKVQKIWENMSMSNDLFFLGHRHLFDIQIVTTCQRTNSGFRDSAKTDKKQTSTFFYYDNLLFFVHNLRSPNPHSILRCYKKLSNFIRSLPTTCLFM